MDSSHEEGQVTPDVAPMDNTEENDTGWIAATKISRRPHATFATIVQQSSFPLLQQKD